MGCSKQYNQDGGGPVATKLLEKAFAEAAKLPADDQSALAEWILEEIQSERRWQDAFAASPAELGYLAKEAEAEFRAGKTRPLDTAEP
jgi:hypothetical protein